MRHFFRLILFIFSLSVLSLDGNAALSFKEIHNEIKNALDKSHEGKSPLQKSFSGESQLLSCQTGIKDSRFLITGLNVKPKQGWIIKNPSITATADNYSATVSKQMGADLQTTKDLADSYNHTIVFPIFLEGEPQKDITLKVNTEWTSCPKDYRAISECFIEQRNYELPLSVTENYPTVYCGYLSNALKAVAIDIKQTDIKTQNTLLPNGNLMLRFIFPKKNDFLEFQTKNNRQLTSIMIQPEEKIWTIILKADHPLSIGEKIPLLIRTTNGHYSVDIQVENKPLPLLAPKLSIWSAFWIGLFFFILTPIWCYWLAPNKLTEKTKNLIPKIKKLQISYGISLLALGILWCLNVPLYGWTDFMIPNLIAIGIAFYLLLRPFQNLWLIGILTLLLPKPFWDFIEYISTPAKIGLLLWFFLFPYIMFNIWKMTPKGTLSSFKKLQKTDTISYHIFVRMPYIILVIWLSLTLICSLTTSDISDIRNETETPAIIQVVSPTSLSDMKDSIFTFPALKGFPVYRIKEKNEWVKQRKKDYNLDRMDFNILITTDNQEIIMPKNLSVRKIKQFIRQYY